MTDINYRTLRGIDGYLAAFPYALQGLEGKRLHNVVEAVHSGVPEGWHPTEEDVAAIAHRKNRGRLTPEEIHAICARIDTQHQQTTTDNNASAKPAHSETETSTATRAGGQS